MSLQGPVLSRKFTEYEDAEQINQLPLNNQILVPSKYYYDCYTQCCCNLDKFQRIVLDKMLFDHPFVEIFLSYIFHLETLFSVHISIENCRIDRYLQQAFLSPQQVSNHGTLSTHQVSMPLSTYNKQNSSY